MTLSRASGASSPVSVPEAVPRLLRDLVHEHTGIYFESDRLDAMIEKLQPRAAHNRCTSFLDYYYLLKYDQAGPEEWRRVMDVFSVQETYFWREYDQIRALVDEVVPRWFRATDRPLRIWSAACASGEEPYSIAMALEEAGWGQHPIELHASDASESALQKAQAAVYRERSFRSLPPPLRSKYFRASPEGDRLSPEITSRVRYRWANLVRPDGYADLQDVHVIFCRNVFIYFSPDSITKVAGYFSQRMPPRGNLFIGASESLLKLTDQFELQEIRGAFVYQRRLHVSER
jgi:chemotaxis protein methyltransferase CheR